MKLFQRKPQVSKPDFRRIQSYADSIDRLVRLMRAEVENQVALVDASPDLAVSTTVPNPLQAFFEGDEAFAPTVADPYKELIPGLLIGFDAEGEKGHVVVSARQQSNYAADGTANRVARLSLNPVFTKTEKPKWVTLEAKIDPAAVKAASVLEMDFISHIEVASDNSADIPQVFHTSLRVSHTDGTFQDVLRRALPLSSVPLGQTLSYTQEQLKELQFKSGSWCTLLFELPTKGAYSFHLDWFALRMQKA